MAGAPIAVKDLFCTKNVQTTASSKILKKFIPPYESTVTSKLWDSGAILLGKLNCDEFAMGSSNETSAYGNVINPYQESGENLVPGGSSGGCSSAVSANLTSSTVGTDTGGSIRQPASFTGIVGLKPTYGRCSRWGIVAFASSLDQAGPMTKDVSDSALMLDVISGYDEKDSTSANIEKGDFLNSLNKNIKGLKVGIPKEYIVDNMPKEIQTLWDKGIEWMKESGAIIKNISLPNTKYALPTYYIVAPAEASSNLARYDGVKYGFRAPGKDLIEMYENTRAEGFGNEVKRRIMIGTYVLSSGYYDAYYLKAQQVRRLIKNDFDLAFKEYCNRWRFKRPTPYDFFRTMEEASGVDLDWFWNGWFFSTDHVDIALKSVYEASLDSLNPADNLKKDRNDFNNEPKMLFDERNKSEQIAERVNLRPELLDIYDEYDPFTPSKKEMGDYEEVLDDLYDKNNSKSL